MYKEVAEFVKLIEELLEPNLFELNEIENILFKAYSKGYEEGFEDGRFSDFSQ